MATVIRGKGPRNEATTPAVRPATFTFSDMSSQGDAYVQSIRREAAKAIEEANQEAEAIRQRAEQAGKSAAEAAIHDHLQQRIGAEMKSLRPALEGVVNRIEAARGEWLEHWRTAALRVAAAMAERIVRRELAADPTISDAWLTEALQLAAGSSNVTVRLAPADYEHLRGHAESVAETLAQLGDARVVADDAVEPGGCLVETRHGAIDQQLTTQLERLTTELG